MAIAGDNDQDIFTWLESNSGSEENEESCAQELLIDNNDEQQPTYCETTLKAHAILVNATDAYMKNDISNATKELTKLIPFCKQIEPQTIEGTTILKENSTSKNCLWQLS